MGAPRPYPLNFYAESMDGRIEIFSRTSPPGSDSGRVMILVNTDWSTRGKAMAVRLVVTFHAAPGKGAELAQAMKARCEVSRQDAGCEQFEVFQSVSEPDKLVLLELWRDQAALDAHAKLQAQRPSLPEGLRLGAGEREDYTHNRTR
jgi:quinol monooxygenase YgiN